jgi:adenylate cyclase
MNRTLIGALLIGVVVTAVAGVLHAIGALLPFETAMLTLISHHGYLSPSTPGNVWQFAVMLLVASGVAWLTLTSAHRSRIGWLSLVLLIELIGLTWICSLYRISFQPLPALLAVGLAFVVAERWAALSHRSQSHLAKSFFSERLSKSQMHRMIEGDIPLETNAKAHDVTVVVCDIANKYDMAEESDPGAFAQTTEAFIRRITDLLLEADGYIQAADGEGVVAVFGFPDSKGDHADKAVRVALGLADSFNKARQQNNGSDLFGKCDVHVGVSSGSIIVAPLQNGARPGLLSTGEPVELARRFCVANRFYGSRVLIGPRTFELASKNIVARPIDFLSGVNSQERHEIYEPLWLAAEAKPEHIARRDSFWNGVVLYREKRWAEAYLEFQKARGPDGDEDAPLQLYLRRLETLALHLTVPE